MCESKRSTSESTPSNTIREYSVSDSNLNCVDQEEEGVKKSGPDHVASSSCSPVHVCSNEVIVITSIRAADLALGLKRIPAGFYTVVQHSGLEWRTENKRSSVNNNVLEWHGLIPIPSDLSATLRLEIYASFEFQPMLGNGERLRQLTITMEQLLDCSAKNHAFTFLPNDGDVVSPCSSLSVTVRRWKCESGDSSASRVLDPHCSTSECRDQLGITMDEGHNALLRYKKHGKRLDIDCSIEQFERALNICPPDHSIRATAQSNLATAKFILCKVDGIDVSIDVPIRLYRDALSARPVGHVDRPSTLIQLASVHFARFENWRDEVDVAQAEALLHEAIGLVPADSHENQVASIMLQLHSGRKTTPVQSLAGPAMHFTDGDPETLSTQLLKHYKRSRHLDDLQKAISLLEGFIKSSSPRDPRYPKILHGLGLALLSRFRRRGEEIDLDQAISRIGDAVNLTSNGHPTKPVRLNNLGTSFFTRFEHFGKLSDLEYAISTLGDADDLTPDDHPDKPTRLNNLGTAFLTRFERLGEPSDLERAILTLGDALALAPDSHSDRPASLNNLGNSFRIRFERFGELSDLEQAILRIREAVDLTPDGHPAKVVRLNNLGTAFRARFEHLGQLHDLEQAISRQGDAVDLTPDGRPDKPTRLNNLGLCFFSRFQHLGELADLERAISLQGDAVDLTPVGHPHKPARLSNLGTSFKARFERLREPVDLERAISRQEDAINLTPDGHPHKPAWLNNLGTSFFTRFEHFRELSDLGRAIPRFGKAVDLTSNGHPDKPVWLNNLGISFVTRFEHLGELGDLDRAILALGSAVNLTPDTFPHKPAWLYNLGTSFRARFKHLGELGDLDRAISLFAHSASHSTGPPTDRFNASWLWISYTRASGHHSLLHAYSVAIGLLPQLAWIGLSLTHRYNELITRTDIVREAAAAALDSGLPEIAVELLEQGRSIVWGELFQLRSSHDQLSAAYPDHARKLQELSAELEQAGATREKSLSSPLEPTYDARCPLSESLQQEVTNRHRALAIERDKLLQEIRGLPGFEQFLSRKEFSQLRASAHSGPVVILNAAKSRCDALIVLADVENVLHVPLPNFTLGRSTRLQDSLNGLVRDARAIRLGEREGQAMPHDLAGQWKSILSSLWTCVVKPVLDSLAFVAPGTQSRIFWCPTGPFTFLPIHAAGFYDAEHSQPGHKVFDFVVSSYVPTLSVLGPSPEFDATSSGDLHFLAVRQPPSDGLSRLPGVDAELRCIKSIIRNSPSARTALQESRTGTVEEVLDLMKEADWVHFACHGIQDAANPTDSGLCLANERRLKLPDIIALSRPRGGLAFLSACQTAMGDKALSDEAIHIAAGMLFAGYGGVVGTMWSISDMLAPEVAKDVYGQLLSKGTRPDYREAAQALQEAVRRLRDKGASFSDWLPFIHVGF